jgi:hypothetical protein
MIHFKLPFGKHMICKYPELELDVKVDNQFLVEDDKFIVAYVEYLSWHPDVIVVETGNSVYPTITGTYEQMEAIVHEMLKYD